MELTANIGCFILEITNNKKNNTKQKIIQNKRNNKNKLNFNKKTNKKNK